MRLPLFFTLIFGLSLLAASGVLSIGHQQSTGGEWMLVYDSPIDETGHLERIHLLSNGQRYALRLSESKPFADAPLSPSGRWIVFPNENNFAQLIRADPDGSNRHVVMELDAAPAYYDEILWSPDSRWIAVSYAVDSVSSPRLILARSDGQSPTSIELGGRKEQFVWSPNADWLVFVSSFDILEGGNFAIVRTRPDGSDYERMTLSELEFIAMPRITHDSQWLIFQGHAQGAWNIYRMNMLDQAVETLTTQVEHGAMSMSPTGEWLAYLSNKAGYTAIFRMRPDGTEPIQLTGEGDIGYGALQWSPDGEFIYLTENNLIYQLKVESQTLNSIQIASRPTKLEVLPIPNPNWRGWMVVFLGIFLVGMSLWMVWNADSPQDQSYG